MLNKQLYGMYNVQLFIQHALFSMALGSKIYAHIVQLAASVSCSYTCCMPTCHLLAYLLSFQSFIVMIVIGS